LFDRLQFGRLFPSISSNHWCEFIATCFCFIQKWPQCVWPDCNPLFYMIVSWNHFKFERECLVKNYFIFNGCCRKVVVFLFSPRDRVTSLNTIPSPPPHFNTKSLRSSVCLCVKDGGVPQKKGAFKQRKKEEWHSLFFWKEKLKKSHFDCISAVVCVQTTLTKEEGGLHKLWNVFIIHHDWAVCFELKGKWPWEKSNVDNYLFFLCFCFFSPHLSDMYRWERVYYTTRTASNGMCEMMDRSSFLLHSLKALRKRSDLFLLKKKRKNQEKV
jgi:hypothetical protein